VLTIERLRSYGFLINLWHPSVEIAGVTHDAKVFQHALF
jgi:hypothetical protein